MAWNTIRRATDNDVDNLNEAARKFAERHGLKLEKFIEGDNDYFYLDCKLEHLADARLNGLWKRVTQRALKSKAAEGIAHGYVGYHTD